MDHETKKQIKTGNPMGCPLKHQCALGTQKPLDVVNLFSTFTRPVYSPVPREHRLQLLQGC